MISKNKTSEKLQGLPSKQSEAEIWPLKLSKPQAGVKIYEGGIAGYQSSRRLRCVRRLPVSLKLPGSMRSPSSPRIFKHNFSLQDVPSLSLSLMAKKRQERIEYYI